MKKTLIMALIATLSIASLPVLGQEKDKGEHKGRGERGSRMERGGQRGGRGGAMQGMMMARILQNPEMAEKLGFTEEEAKELKAKMDAFRTDGEDIRKQLMEIGRKQAELLKNDKITEEMKAEIMALVEMANEIHAKQAVARIEQMLLLKEAIGPEKIKLIKQHMKERMQEMRKRRGEKGGEGRQGRGGVDREGGENGGKEAGEWERRRKGTEEERKRRREKRKKQRDGDDEDGN